MATIEQDNNNTNTTSGTKKKASAFINVQAVSGDGEKRKNLGGIPLYADNPFHASLLKHLNKGGSVNLETGINIVASEEDNDAFFAE